MDSTEKRIKETIEKTSDNDLYSIGDAQVASEEAKEKAYRLQHEAEENNKEEKEQKDKK